MVGFELTNEQRLLEQSVREWGAREVAPLTPSRNAGTPARTDFHLGVAVSPFKTVERDQIPQYLKLEMKVRAGARYAITPNVLAKQNASPMSRPMTS